jgi:hypothetical protein
MKNIPVFFFVFLILFGFAQAKDLPPLTEKQVSYCRSVIEYDPSYTAKDIKDMNGFCRCLHVPGKTSLDCENVYLLRREYGTCQAFKESVETIDGRTKVDCACFKKYQAQITTVMNSPDLSEGDKEKKSQDLSARIVKQCIKPLIVRGAR